MKPPQPQPAPGGPVTVRPMAAADLAGVAALFDQYRQFYEQPADAALARRFMAERFERGESVVLVAEEKGGALLGFCQLYPSFCSVQAAPIYVLYDLFTAQSARRRGVGRMLLQAAARRAAQDGKARMDLSTARSNLQAQALYESLGWVRDEVFFCYSRGITVQSAASGPPTAEA